MIKSILHIEGLIVLLVSLYFYQVTNGNWLLFALLILVPDVSMLGYLKNKKLGAITYNLGHNYILSLLLVLTGIIMDKQFVTQLGLILTAHVGMDRFMGYGLKYPSHFKDTHLQKV